MVETRSVLRSKLDAFKTQLSPLFHEICQWKCIILIDKSESELPFCFQDIKAKFDDARYLIVQELDDDMKLLVVSIKETFKEGDLFDAAIELELYIARTIDPIIHANGILDLYQTKTKDGTEANMQLNTHNAIQEGYQYETFMERFSPEERIKMFLRWPLPKNNLQDWYVEEAKKAGIKATAGLSVLDLMSTKDTFFIDDSQFKVGAVSFFQMLKYNIYITKRNRIHRKQFVTRYVDKYLMAATLYNFQLNDLPIAQAQLELWFLDVHKLNRALRKNLYGIIKPIVTASLQHHKGHFSKIFKLDLEQRPYLIKYSSYVSGGWLNPVLENYNSGTAFNGLNRHFDLSVGYYAFLGLLGGWPVLAPYTGLGNNKYITFELKSCIKHLQSADLWNENREYTNEEQITRNCIKEVEDTLYKLTTQCVHLGVTRFLLTDHNGFLLVKLKFEKEQVALTYGTSLSHPAQYIKSEYSYFSRDETYIRLYILSFFAMDQELIDEITEFRSLISQKYEEIRNSTIDEQDEVIAKEMEDDKIGDFCGELAYSPNTELMLCDSSSESFEVEVDNTLFKKVSYVELGDMITEIRSIGDTTSQVVKIDSAKFVKSIPLQNMLVKGRLPLQSVLRVYDPFLGLMRRENIEQRTETEKFYYDTMFSYQESIDKTVLLVSKYCLLSEFSGDFIPRLYSYGRLCDLSPSVSDLYLRFSGGYLMTEDLEGEYIEDATEEFFNSTILPLLEKLHSKNVILNLGHFYAIITEDGQFKIISLRQAKFSSNPEKKRRDISDAAHTFKRSDW